MLSPHFNMSLGNALCSINKISQLLNYLVRFPRSMRKGTFGAALLFVFLILFSALTCSDWGLHGTSKISGWLSWAGLLTFLWCGHIFSFFFTRYKPCYSILYSAICVATSCNSKRWQPCYLATDSETAQLLLMRLQFFLPLLACHSCEM